MAGLMTLGRSLLTNLGDAASTAYISKFKSNGEPDTPCAFQYFPATITDGKSNNWGSKEIPGASLPLYGWVSGGARTIGFTAQFTTDVDIAYPSRPTDVGGGGGKAYLARLASFNEDRRNIDIRSAVAWLRQFMYPTYGAPSAVGVPIVKAPSTVRLVLPGTGIGAIGGDDYHPAGWEDTIAAIMTTCEVTWEAFFPSGTPRICSVSLAFEQIAQYPGMIAFPSATRIAQAAAGDDVFYGYSMSTRKATMKKPNG